ncbi:MAG: hypothetical protein ABI183_26875 [Polyangiaceae bacterium]
MILRLKKLLAASLVLPLIGCTGTVESPGAPDADSSELAAAISLETTSYADDATPSHSTAVARFIRARSTIDLPTLKMLGASIDLPPNGTCSAAPTPTGSAGHGVELVDVGAINIDAAGHDAFLAPRNLPDMDDLVWGVVYSARAYGTDALLSGPISIRVAGSKDVGAFSIDVADLQAPANVTFDGDALAPIIFRSNEDLHASWTPTPASTDIIYFEIDNGTETLVCAYDDSGSADLPASVLRTSTQGSAPGNGTLTIHRLHREAVIAHGVDDGEARFDFARVYDFVAP